MKITEERIKELFLDYYKVQQESKYNMIVEAWSVMMEMPSNPSQEEYCYILRHYSQLKEKYIK